MTAHLLDVNVLVALIDPTHVHHDRAHSWFADEGSRDWLSCPTTQNGVLRIVSNPRYSNAQPTPAVAVRSLRSLVAVGSHRFVADDVSLLDDPSVDVTRLVTAGEITDVYLLALARRHDARLATFDRRIATGAVKNGGPVVLQVP